MKISIFARLFIAVFLVCTSVAYSETLYEKDRYYVIHEERPSLELVGEELKKLPGGPKFRNLAGANKRRIEALVAAAERKIETEQQNFIKRVNGAGIKPRNVKSFKELVNVTYITLTPEEAQKLKKEGIKLERATLSTIDMDTVIPHLGINEIHSPSNLSVPSRTGKGVKIAVIDTGIDLSHEVFGPCSEAGFINGTCARIVGGANFDETVLGDVPVDDNGHGTHVAGILAGSSTSFKGVAPDAQLVVLKACRSNGSCSDAAIISAFNYAIAAGVDIISISAGSIGSVDSDPKAVAATTATDNGILVVGSAGNDRNSEGKVKVPGAAPKAISVAATNSKDSQYDSELGREYRIDELAYFSSGGPAIWSNGEKQILKPDIAAPGVKICSAYLGNSFACMRGTSMSTPIVAGVAALVLEEHPTWTPAGVKSAILGTGRLISDFDENGIEIGTEQRRLQGHGLVQPAAALAIQTELIAEIDPISTVITGDFQLTGTVKSAEFINYQIHYRPYAATDADWTLVAQVGSEVVDGVLANLSYDVLTSSRGLARLTVNTASGSYRREILLRRLGFGITAPVGLSPDANDTPVKIYSSRKPIEVRGIIQGDMTSFVIEWCWYTAVGVTEPSSLTECYTDGVTINQNAVVDQDQLLGSINLPSLPSGLLTLRLTGHKGDGSSVYAGATIFYDPDARDISPYRFGERTAIRGNGLSLANIDDDGVPDLVAVSAGNESGAIHVLDYSDYSYKPGWPVNISASFLRHSSIAFGEYTSQRGSSDLILHSERFLNWLTFSGGAVSSNSPLELVSIDPDYPEQYDPLVKGSICTDLNGDGSPDYLLSDARAFNSDWSSVAGLGFEETFTEVHYAYSKWYDYAAVGDVTGDAGNEVVLIGRSSTSNPYNIKVLNVGGTELWSKELTLDTDYYPYGSVSPAVLVDVDLDGKKEIIFKEVQLTTKAPGGFGYLPKLWIIRGDGSNYNANFPQVISGTFGSVPSPNFISAGDLDGDSYPELVFSLDKATLAVWNHTVGFYKIPLNGNAAGGVTITNLDRDSKLEILVNPDLTFSDEYFERSTHWLYAYNDDGSYVEGFPKFLPELPYGHGIPVADLNGDDKQEMVMTSQEGDLWAFELNACSVSPKGWYQFAGDASRDWNYRAPLSIANCPLGGKRTFLTRGGDLLTPEAQQPSFLLDYGTGATPPWERPADPEPEVTNTPEPEPEATSTIVPEPEATNTPEPEPEATSTIVPEPEGTNTPEPEPEITNTPQPEETNTVEPEPQETGQRH